MASRSAPPRQSIPIKRGDKLPLEVGGTPLGRVWGNLTASAKVSPDGREVDASVTIPQLYVTLPQSIGHTVQSMEANPFVHIGVHPDGARRLVAVPLEKPARPSTPGSTRIHLAVALGNDVWVTRDTMLKIQLHDGPVVDVGDKTIVSGRVTAGPGTIELQSKRFELDDASVSFVLAATDKHRDRRRRPLGRAGQDARDVDVSGRAEHLNIDFHSEPDLPKDAILSLILFGDENGSFGSSQATPLGDNEDVNTAAGVAGGVVTQGINKAISGVTSADITTRVDTSESQNPRPELAVQITKDVSATVAYNLGLPPRARTPTERRSCSTTASSETGRSSRPSGTRAARSPTFSGSTAIDARAASELRRVCCTSRRRRARRRRSPAGCSRPSPRR